MKKFIVIVCALGFLSGCAARATIGVGNTSGGVFGRQSNNDHYLQKVIVAVSNVSVYKIKLYGIQPAPKTSGGPSQQIVLLDTILTTDFTTIEAPRDIWYAQQNMGLIAHAFVVENGVDKFVGDVSVFFDLTDINRRSSWNRNTGILGGSQMNYLWTIRTEHIHPVNSPAVVNANRNTGSSRSNSSNGGSRFPTTNAGARMNEILSRAQQ